MVVDGECVCACVIARECVRCVCSMGICVCACECVVNVCLFSCVSARVISPVITKRASSGDNCGGGWCASECIRFCASISDKNLTLPVQ